MVSAQITRSNSRMSRASITLIVDTFPLWRPRSSSTGTWLHLCSAFTLVAGRPQIHQGIMLPARTGRSFLRNCSMSMITPAAGQIFGSLIALHQKLARTNFPVIADRLNSPQCEGRILISS
jgi:hypothetical protein